MDDMYGLEAFYELIFEGNFSKKEGAGFQIESENALDYLKKGECPKSEGLLTAIEEYFNTFLGKSKEVILRIRQAG